MQIRYIIYRLSFYLYSFLSYYSDPSYIAGNGDQNLTKYAKIRELANPLISSIRKSFEHILYQRI